VDVGSDFTFLNTGRCDFLTIYCHSLWCDAAEALSDTTTYIQSPQGDSAMDLEEFALSDRFFCDVASFIIRYLSMFLTS